MLKSIFGKIINNNENKLSQLRPVIKDINALEEKFSKLSDAQIIEHTQKWQKDLRDKKLTDLEVQNKLNDLVPEAFALVREAAKRSVNQRHRDVQLIAGIALHRGKIAEQKAGEGKTLTATLPLYLNSLAGLGAHLVTPNDYLSMHGAGWYGPVYQALGVSVGVIVDRKAYKYDPNHLNSETLDEYSRHLKPVSRLEAYECDITYGTNSEFGFDYLRDNMAVTRNRLVQSNPVKSYAKQFFAIVDEVDFVLIDIARTPLIISEQKDMPSELYKNFAKLADELVLKTDYTIDEKLEIVTLTELAINKIERKLNVENLYEKDFETVHHIENALKAKALMIKDKDYVVQNGQITIVDPNTGRLLHGNRWSNGLHRAVEAKEGVIIQPESKTVASISYQNYFRLYTKLAGMTGTASTESDELYKMYSLDVVSIPTHKPVMRIDRQDLVYKTMASKFRAVAKEIAERYEKGQPVLVGTTSVEKSQMLSNFLKRLQIPHEILNAKHHEKEAVIIAQAGKKSAVTVATNMAGRGVDIILGGDPYSEATYNDVVKSGGLYVIGTERHDSRRIDNQLRGRAGRQGDPGESRFFLSLQDDLLRIFGGDKIKSVMQRLGVDENVPIESSIISKSIENAQKKVEGINFDKRKNVVEFDGVLNVQREAIYEMRRRILLSGESESEAEEFFKWILDKLGEDANLEFQEIWDKKLKRYKAPLWYEAVKRVALEVIDVLWMEHIDIMDDLSTGMGLRAYGQEDPLIEYKREGKNRFQRLLDEIWRNVKERLTLIEIESVPNAPLKSPTSSDLNYQKGEFESGVEDETEALNAPLTPVLSGSQSKGASDRPKRNDLCPCGSGKKYKHCHGK